MQRIYIKGLEIFAFHGVNPEEKADGQKFILDITLHADLSAAMASDDLADTVNYAAVRKAVQRVMTGEKYDLIEHTAARVADAILADFPQVAKAEVLLKKPDAPMNAVFDYVAVEVVRTREDSSFPIANKPSAETSSDGHVAVEVVRTREDSSFPVAGNPSAATSSDGHVAVEVIRTREDAPVPEKTEQPVTAPSSPDWEAEEADLDDGQPQTEDDSALGKGKKLLKKLAGPGYQQAYIALGTNMGDKGENLNRAVWALASIPGVKVSALSRVYETKPVGFVKQDNFYNAVIRVETTLSPRALLGACLGVEAGMGRVRGRKNGPRVIDLDLLLYEGKVINSEELTLPHPRMEERAFVLSPLCDILQDPYYLGCLKRVGRDGVKTCGASLIKP